MHPHDVIPGQVLRGLVPDGDVTVVQVRPLGERALELTYKDARGKVNSQLVYQDDAARLEPVEATRVFAFDADPELVRLASEAMRIHLAHLFDPHLAVYSSLIEPLPHQITAVYGEMLARQPLRYLLADDPGAGKTIMAGLLIKELKVRGDLERCLVVCPGALAEQWQDELWDRFGLPFDILTTEAIEASRGSSVFADHPLLVARLDKLSRDEGLQEKLAVTDWDLVIVDEAHKMSASFFGSEIKETKRYKLGKLLSRIARHFLLLTATPHNGKEEDFQLFMALLDGDRFEGRFRDGVHATDVSDLMRRLVKEELYRFDGSKLFSERRASTVSYRLSDPEAALYKAVTDYVREEFNRADALENDGRKGTVGFALTILQRRLASSPEAIYQSLRRRRERLERRLREERIRAQGAQAQARLASAGPIFTEDDLEDLEDAPGREQELAQEELVDQATAARTVAELEAEISILRRLEALALEVRQSGRDRKWEELCNLLGERTAMFDSHGARRKLVIFTEHRDTLNYLVERISTLLGGSEPVVAIHGGTGREERQKIQERFLQDKEVHILVATDAAGEGINLQRAHLMVNYDLPWNPNRIEQRFGRIHRIGQTEVCHLWNLLAEDTREGDVYLTLFRKLEAERESLGSGVFDVLGKAIDGKELRQLLIEAIRYGERPEVRRRLQERVESALDRAHLEALLEEHALVHDVMDRSRVERVREEMERAAAMRLQPHYVSAFFRAAFSHLGGSLHEREAGRYEVSHVPTVIRSRDRQIGRGAAVLPRYERIAFEKERMRVPGRPPAELLAPGHPLLEATIDIILERYGPLLRRGSVLVAEEDASHAPRVLLILEASIRGGRPDARGERRLVSRQLEFVELLPDGSMRRAGAAPYLDYRAPTEAESSAIVPLLGAPWLKEDLEARAVAFAAQEMMPRHLAEVQARREELLQKTHQAVRERLTKEIAYWDRRANELRLQEQAGREPRHLNSVRALRRADELTARLRARERELAQERYLGPHAPQVLGAALVIPRGALEPSAEEAGRFARETRRVEAIAMAAVIAAERALGHEPRDVHEENRGYDIESAVGGGRLRFLEVKGRIMGADTVTVTANEIRTGLNRPEDFILALVEVAPEESTDPPLVRYVRRPFSREPDFIEASVNFKWLELWRRGAAPHELPQEADRGRAAASGDQ